MPKKQVVAVKENSVNEGQVGQRLRAIRMLRKLSINELSLKAGVSTGMVSQIERGLANPSIKMLERLRQALDVPLTSFLEDSVPERQSALENGFDDVEAAIRRVNDRPVFQVGPNGIVKELLSPRRDHDLQFMIVLLPAGVGSEEVLIGSGEKAGLVLEGNVLLQIADQSAELFTGDSFQFSSTLPHSLRNGSDRTARILWIMNTKRPVVHI
ncbi:helix-turn-helix domain-containing protein [Burkholderia sp. Leaf177]|uniref:helix-turn-helix domain-containing protein n=1 Tax=Burkholderia sp. Leaf177 TaxID=1736287 RepID=UPI0009E93C76|nr:helix-turn-helix domain-containing protein [Burkholderia sp. Leaf177]